MSKTPETAKAYEWDFDGACAPDENGRQKMYQLGLVNFTLGIFQWLPKARGKGMKRGPVVARIKGKQNNPRPAYDAARAEINRRNSQQDQHHD